MDKIGIYIIYFDDPEHCYIGQSQRVETRIRKHKEMLVSNTHYNYKLQEAYNLSTKTIVAELLEECKPSELNSLEIYYINEFNSIDTGYNILSGGDVPIGYQSSRSKYTREILIQVYTLLADETLTNLDIIKICEVPMTLLESLAYNKRHKWLAEEFPILREKIDCIIRSNTRSKLCNDYNLRNGVSYIVLDPYNETHTFSNINRFAKEHGLNPSHLNQVVLGKEKQHKGWRKGAQHVV